MTQTVQQILDDLGELCACESEQQDPKCIFCESRLQIRFQRRTIDLLTDRLRVKHGLPRKVTL